MRRDLSIAQAIRQALRQHFQDADINVPPELAPRPGPAPRSEAPTAEQLRQALVRQLEGLGKIEDSDE